MPRTSLAGALAAVALFSAACGSDDGSPDSAASPAPADVGDCVEGEPETTDSGLVVEDLECGDGPEAERGSVVVVHYRGALESGEEFDSSYGVQPFPFVLGAGEVIAGWDEGVPGMKVGGKRKLTIPPELGYGEAGVPGIPPNSTLVFEVELLEVREQ
ncbi:MAG TPA: FKBP-type peptidyl-prolyl cis-trans isomerase [Actinomycetota bacterium]|nr:FKBP-type peptidyl-prolyl cis-trans isomerase [Actinomycetota bacterium]HVM35533.1 FKBP-type peptidyl-prolyl cis-trans isomerase [Actinomycetota bacterium]